MCYAHIFKSKSISSSKVRIGGHVLENKMKGNGMKKYHQKRSCLKYKNIFSLTRIIPILNNDIMKLQNDIYKIYFKPDIISISDVLLKHEIACNLSSLNIVNTINGAMMVNNDEIPIFILIPREEVINDLKYKKDNYMNSLKRTIKKNQVTKEEIIYQVNILPKIRNIKFWIFSK